MQLKNLLEEVELCGILQIILKQERTIHRLNELVRSLEQRLLQCEGRNGTANDSVSPLTEQHVIEQEQQNLVGD